MPKETGTNSYGNTYYVTDGGYYYNNNDGKAFI
jgi:hypothetical protein